MKIKILTIVFSLAIGLTGCYTQLATYEYDDVYTSNANEKYYDDRENENYSYNDYADTNYSKERFEGEYESENYETEENQTFINNYYYDGWPTYRRYYWGYYPSTFWVTGVYFYDPFYDPWFDPFWYPGTCLVSPYYYNYGWGWYSPYYYTHYDNDYGIYKYRTHSSRLRNSDGLRSSLSANRNSGSRGSTIRTGIDRENLGLDKNRNGRYFDLQTDRPSRTIDVSGDKVGRQRGVEIYTNDQDKIRNRENTETKSRIAEPYREDIQKNVQQQRKKDDNSAGYKIKNESNYTKDALRVRSNNWQKESQSESNTRNKKSERSYERPSKPAYSAPSNREGASSRSYSPPSSSSSSRESSSGSRNSSSSRSGKSRR